MKEKSIQKSIAEALDLSGVTWAHIPNENKLLSKANNPGHIMSIMKKMGLKPGIPDVMIFDQPPELPHKSGAALELKSPGNKPTKNQREWLKKLDACNWETAWQQGFDDAYQQLKDWGYV